MESGQLFLFFCLFLGNLLALVLYRGADCRNRGHHGTLKTVILPLFSLFRAIIAKGYATARAKLRGPLIWMVFALHLYCSPGWCHLLEEYSVYNPIIFIKKLGNSQGENLKLSYHNKDVPFLRSL